MRSTEENTGGPYKNDDKLCACSAADIIIIGIVRLLALAVLRAVLLQRLCYAPHPRIRRSLALDDKKGRLARLSSHVSTSAHASCGKHTHGHHDKLLWALALDARDHPAHLFAFRALLTARRWRLCLAQPKVGLDPDPASALERLEAQQAMARQRELANLRLALRDGQRQQ